MITFKEDQSKIFIGKHKLQKSSFPIGYLDHHLIYAPDEKSWYGDMMKDKFIASKFVRVITFENIYDFETLKKVVTENFEEDVLEEVKYFDSGGYLYDKKSF